MGAVAAARRGEEDLQRAEQAARQDLQQDHRRQRGGHVGGGSKSVLGEIRCTKPRSISDI